MLSFLQDVQWFNVNRATTKKLGLTIRNATPQNNVQQDCTYIVAFGVKLHKYD